MGKDIRHLLEYSTDHWQSKLQVRYSIDVSQVAFLEYIK